MNKQSTTNPQQMIQSSSDSIKQRVAEYEAAKAKLDVAKEVFAAAADAANRANAAVATLEAYEQAALTALNSELEQLQTITQSCLHKFNR